MESITSLIAYLNKIFQEVSKMAMRLDSYVVTEYFVALQYIQDSFSVILYSYIS